MVMTSSLSDDGIEAMRAVMREPGRTLLATDFDGVLSPIVDDPQTATALPAAITALGRAAQCLGQVAVITGRPARQAVELGGLDRARGLDELIVLGQYGVERWDAATGEYQVPPEPRAIADVEAALPTVLAQAGHPQARIEHKGRALAVHTRTLDDADAAFEALRGPVTALADEHGLKVEPGKLVLEIRPSGTDKGDALKALAADARARTVIYAGDDLGDIPAFEAVRELRAAGLNALSIYSLSSEESAVRSLSDLVVDGPEGFARWLARLADSLDSRANAFAHGG